MKHTLRARAVTAVITLSVAAGASGVARADEPLREPGPTGGVALGIAGSGPALQARAGWRVVPRVVADAQVGLYAFTADLIGKSSDGSVKTNYISTRFATVGASAWLLPGIVAGLHGGVVRLAELVTDATGTAEVTSMLIPAVDVSAGWQFLRRPAYALGVEMQGWACFSDRAGFLMDGALLLGAQIK